MSKQAKKGTAKGPIQKAVHEGLAQNRGKFKNCGECNDPQTDPKVSAAECAKCEKGLQETAFHTYAGPRDPIEYAKRHLTCKVCGYEWVSRKTFPKQCPGCKSQRWNRGTPDPQAVLKLRLEGIKRLHAESPKYVSTHFAEIEKAITAKIKELDEQEMADYEAIRKESE